MFSTGWKVTLVVSRFLAKMDTGGQLEVSACLPRGGGGAKVHGGGGGGMWCRHNVNVIYVNKYNTLCIYGRLCVCRGVLIINELQQLFSTRVTSRKAKSSFLDHLFPSGTLNNLEMWRQGSRGALHECVEKWYLKPSVNDLWGETSNDEASWELTMYVHVCMPRCIMHVCVYVCVCVCMYVCIYVCMHSMYVYMCVYNMCVHVYVYVCVCMYACVGVCVCVCIICVYVCVYVCVCMCVCMYVCMYVYTYNVLSNSMYICINAYLCTGLPVLCMYYRDHCWWW